MGRITEYQGERSRKTSGKIDVDKCEIHAVLSGLRKFGRVNRPLRPWLGLFATEVDDRIVVTDTNPRGPAARAEPREGDIILAIESVRVKSRRDLVARRAGIDVTLTLHREGRHL